MKVRFNVRLAAVLGTSLLSSAAFAAETDATVAGYAKCLARLQPAKVKTTRNQSEKFTFIAGEKILAQTTKEPGGKRLGFYAFNKKGEAYFIARPLAAKDSDKVLVPGVDPKEPISREDFCYQIGSASDKNKIYWRHEADRSLKTPAPAGTDHFLAGSCGTDHKGNVVKAQLKVLPMIAAAEDDSTHRALRKHVASLAAVQYAQLYQKASDRDWTNCKRLDVSELTTFDACFSDVSFEKEFVADLNEALDRFSFNRMGQHEIPKLPDVTGSVKPILCKSSNNETLTGKEKAGDGKHVR